MSTFPVAFQDAPHRWASRLIEVLLTPLALLLRAPSFFFLAALTAMLLRHPDVQFYEIDRVAFGLLAISVVGGLIVRRERPFLHRASWPMLAIGAMVLASAAGRPFDHETWSLLASKFLVPFTLFHFAAKVFCDQKEKRRFELFAVVMLAYLSLTAIAFLAGAHFLIFPQFILDESLGFHVDRARGPLLQAVANGVSLNILGLLAVHAYRRGRFRNLWIVVLLFSLPVAIVATMTRTVWLTFAGSVLAVALISQRRRWLVLAGFIAIAGIIAGGIFLGSSRELSATLADRMEEQGPVNFRKAVYAGGWEMFWERPLVGWGFHRMPGELPRYVTGYDEKVLYPHNTYLELLVEHGLLGLALYVWLMWELWQLRRGAIGGGESNFVDREFQRVWPLILLVYWVNAALVVMSYQFVNGLLFTLAGMLAGQQRRAALEHVC
jgi:putative inorganic carbon (HCO3(-)) transporter